MGSQGYERFTGPQRLDRDLHELEGILRGIALDGVITHQELSALSRWCADRAAAAQRSPFNELIPMIEAAASDGVLDTEEREDILWLCSRVRTPNAFFAVATADMQRLHGLLVGIAADGRINEVELAGLRAWAEGAGSLRGTWPYDEIDAVITGVMADGRIDEDENRALLTLCREILDSSANLVLELPFGEDLVRFGVCASCPEIMFEGRRFCITGASPDAPRSKIEDVIRRLRGEPIARVRTDLDYLIVAGERSASWAFSCYGRKIEQAVALRKRGARLAIVHESDFWDAAEDCGERRPQMG